MMRDRLFGYLNENAKEREETEQGRQEALSELVIEENTIYEIDRECIECQHKKRGL